MLLGEKRAKVGDALRGGISWRCRVAVNSLLRKGYATCQRLPSPNCPIHPLPTGDCAAICRKGIFLSDPFTDVVRDGALKLIEQAIHSELATLMAAFSNEKLEDGRARLVYHGHLPEREVMTGIGPVPVKVPRVRDRIAGEDKITFTPSILPRYLHKAKSVAELMPWVYLKGVSTGDFTEALETLISPLPWLTFALPFSTARDHPRD